MFSRKLSQLCRHTTSCTALQVRVISKEPSSYEQLPELFSDPRVHNLLRLITYTHSTDVHNPRFRMFQKNTTVKLLSDKELQALRRLTGRLTTQRLQLPPVLSPRSDHDTDQHISSDSELQGLFPSNHKLVFVDTSLNIHSNGPRDRLIVVRDATGVLRHASSAERDRINQVYFPLPGRTIRVPMMFRDRYLQDMLNRGQFAYILDRACVQFEPDDPYYISVCRTVYDYVHKLSWIPLQESSYTDQCTNPLRTLRHTRHYGPLALHLICVHANPGALVYEALHSQHYARLGWTLRLSTLLRPASRFAQAFTSERSELPPPVEVDASKLDRIEQSELALRNEDVQKILSYVQLFIECEPLSLEQKNLLTSHVEECSEALDTASA